jgi:hypothetical protein
MVHEEMAIHLIIIVFVISDLNKAWSPTVIL